MKKALKPIGGILLICILGLLVFNSCGDDTPVEGATFDMPSDLIQIEYGKMMKIKFKVPEAINKVELLYNDSLFTTFKNKKGAQQYDLMAHYYGVGARNLVLRSYFPDGTIQDEAIIVRVSSDIMPKHYLVQIVNTFPHNTESYTQGLEFSDGQLYEATGDPGQQGKSLLAKVDLKSGAIGTKIGLDATYFGEGITILNGKIYQLTWQNGKCFVYDKNTLQMQPKSFTYNGQGWGICNDGKQLIMSDGTERITFRDPKTFQILRTIEVYDNIGPKTNLNELEYVDGKVYANIYQSNTVICFDANTGKVLEEIDATELEIMGRNGGDVLNGIAHDPLTDKLYMTGKYWDKLFEVKLKEN